MNKCPFIVELKTLWREGLLEPEFYGDLVYKFKKRIGKNDFSFQFRKISIRYKRIGYNLNVMRHSACLVFNPIMVNNYTAFFNCTPVGRASDSMMTLTKSYSFYLVGTGVSCLLREALLGTTALVLLQTFTKVVLFGFLETTIAGQLIVSVFNHHGYHNLFVCP